MLNIYLNSPCFKFTLIVYKNQQPRPHSNFKKIATLFRFRLIAKRYAGDEVEKPDKMANDSTWYNG